MNLRTSLLLAIVFMALGWFAIFDPLHVKEKKEHKKERENAVLWVKDKKLSSLTILNGETGQRFQMTCTVKDGCPLDSSGDWKLEEPVKDRADNTNIGSLLASIENLTAVDRLSFQEPPNLAEYGLDKPSAELSITPIGESPLFIRVGAKAAVGPNYYAQSSESGNDVLMVASFFRDSLIKDIFQWRNKRVFPGAKTEAVSDMSWDLQGKNLRVLQSDGHWEMDSPLKAKANSTILNGMAGTMAFLSATAIPFDNKDSAEAKKLLGTKPDLRVAVTIDKQPQTLEFFLKSEKEQRRLYVKASTQPWVAQVEDGLFDRFRKPLTDYRNKQLISDDTKAKLAFVDLEFPREKKTAQFKKTDTQEWVQSGGEPVRLSKERLERFLDLLNAAQVQSFDADKAKVQLLSQVQDLRIKFSDKDKKSLGQLSFLVAGKTSAYADGELPGEVRILGNAFLEALPIRLKDLDIDNNKKVVVNDEKATGEAHEHSDSHP